MCAPHIYAMWESTSSSSTQHLPSGCKETIAKKQCSISSASLFFHSCSQLLKRRAFSSTSASEKVAKDGRSLWVSFPSSYPSSSSAAAAGAVASNASNTCKQTRRRKKTRNNQRLPTPILGRRKQFEASNKQVILPWRLCQTCDNRNE